VPALALLSGVALSRAVRLIRRDRSVELFLALPLLGLFLVAIATALIVEGDIWFGQSPAEVVAGTYESSLFNETPKVAAFLQAHTRPEDRIAVLGSEPEIYFYSRRRSATGHIYMYPLLEEQAYAAQMQQQLITQIESQKPACVVFVNDDRSWLQRADSERRILNWWNGYWATNLDLAYTVSLTNHASGLPQGSILVLTRKISN